jgi:pyridoxamine 5'-phosphate oxidase
MGWKTIADIRREYGQLSLDELNVHDCPFAQFDLWFSDVLTKEKSDPTAMVLSTVDVLGHPDSRVVLLKEIKDGAYIFFTNYHSAKSKHIQANPYVALNFYWPEFARQIRIRGRVKQTTKEHSDVYFSSRPKSSQLSAIASPQSCEINGRAEIERRLNELIIKYQQQLVVRPDHWGGYAVTPEEFEFWQGRDSRLHDRIHYTCQDKKWIHRRLAP